MTKDEQIHMLREYVSLLKKRDAKKREKNRIDETLDRIENGPELDQVPVGKILALYIFSPVYYIFFVAITYLIYYMMFISLARINNVMIHMKIAELLSVIQTHFSINPHIFMAILSLVLSNYIFLLSMRYYEGNLPDRNETITRKIVNGLSFLTGTVLTVSVSATVLTVILAALLRFWIFLHTDLFDFQKMIKSSEAFPIILIATHQLFVYLAFLIHATMEIIRTTKETNRNKVQWAEKDRLHKLEYSYFPHVILEEK